MADNFRAHRREGGPRLDELQALGHRGGIRFVDAGAGDVVRRVGLKEVVSLQQNQDPLSKAPGVGAKRSGPKGGRPGLGRPWAAEGISRAEYFRRKKARKGNGFLAGKV